MEGSDRGPLVRCTAVPTLDRSTDKSRHLMQRQYWFVTGGEQIEISVHSDCRFIGVLRSVQAKL